MQNLKDMCKQEAYGIASSATVVMTRLLLAVWLKGSECRRWKSNIPVQV